MDKIFQLLCHNTEKLLIFFFCRADKEVGAIEQAHDSIVWTLAWHPLGHILCSGSNDHSSKFWTRNRPGDQMKDKYNLNTLPAGIAGLEDIDMVGGKKVYNIIGHNFLTEIYRRRKRNRVAMKLYFNIKLIFSG